jgi:hypothetical protein
MKQVEVLSKCGHLFRERVKRGTLLLLISVFSSAADLVFLALLTFH